MKKSKTKKVYAHFNNVDLYLSQKFDIKVRAEIVKKMTGNLSYSNIIDFGCGDGSISLQYQSETNHITLVDISENMLERAGLNINRKYLKNISRMQSDIGSFVSQKKYDVIMGLGLLAHVDSIPETLNVMAGLLKKNGLCLIQLTDNTQFFSKILNFYNRILDKVTGQFGYARNRLSVKEMIVLAAQYDLKYVDSAQYSLTLPGMTCFLPDRLMYQYHSYVWKNRLLSGFGSDFIISFRKSNT